MDNPDHTITISKYGTGGNELSLKEQANRYKSTYRQKLRGAELPNMESINLANQDEYGLIHHVEAPRLVTDDELIDPIKTPISKLTGKEPEVVAQWYILLDQMVAA